VQTGQKPELATLHHKVALRVLRGRAADGLENRIRSMATKDNERLHISTRSIGTSVKTSIGALARSTPNNSAPISTPAGELRASSAIVSPSKPNPRETAP
jgi:hypothetical protein